MIRVGIPRGLLYYQYFPMWKTFFEEMGAEVVISLPTTQAMLTAGSGRVIAETCLPVKVYLGHVLSLVGECDLIFIPAVRSVEEKVYNCSKFLGLPDMTAAVIPESPTILDIDIDINKGKGELYRQIYKLGRHFSPDPFKIRRAALAAWRSYLDFRKMMAVEKLALPDLLDKTGSGFPEETAVSSGPVTGTRATIAVIGHSYMIYDEFINHRLIHRLEQAGHRVLTPEMVKAEELKAAINRITGGSYWTYEEEVVGAGGYYLENEADGIIGIMAFGCGPDSLMMDMVRREAARPGATPFMCLTIDEHTAEAGVITRLEAFTDMIQRKNRKKVEACV